MSEVQDDIEFHSVAELIKKGAQPPSFLQPAAGTQPPEFARDQQAPLATRMGLAEQDFAEWLSQQIRQMNETLTNLQHTVKDSHAELAASVQALGQGTQTTTETLASAVEALHQEIQHGNAGLVAALKELRSETASSLQVLRREAEEGQDELSSVVREMWQDNAALCQDMLSRGQFWMGVSLVILVLSVVASILLFR